MIIIIIITTIFFFLNLFCSSTWTIEIKPFFKVHIREMFIAQSTNSGVQKGGVLLYVGHLDFQPVDPLPESSDYVPPPPSPSITPYPRPNSQPTVDGPYILPKMTRPFRDPTSAIWHRPHCPVYNGFFVFWMFSFINSSYYTQ